MYPGLCASSCSQRGAGEAPGGPMTSSSLLADGAAGPSALVGADGQEIDAQYGNLALSEMLLERAFEFNILQP
jgi:hypothetical protein